MQASVGQDRVADLDCFVQVLEAAEPPCSQSCHKGVAVGSTQGNFRDLNWFAQNIGNDLHPNRIFYTAPHGGNIPQVDTVFLQNVHMLGDGVAHRLQGGLVQMRSGVAEL